MGAGQGGKEEERGVLDTVETDTDNIYDETDFQSVLPPPPSAFCASLLSNLGFGKLWWLIILIQMACLLPPLVLQRLCNLLPVLSFVHLTNILTLYLNTSLWIWAIYLIVALTQCSIGLDNPLFVTGIVFVSVFGVCSILDCFLGREGWYLVDLKPMQDAIKYFDKMKASPPAHRVHIECFHTSTTSALNTRGGVLTRTNKVVSFTDYRDFPMTSWSDLSEWPGLESLAAQGAAIIGVSLAREVEPGDQVTKEAFYAFRNKFVQQNCHRDEQLRTWVSGEIPDMGPEQSVFITTRPREESPLCFRIGFFLCFAALCISCPLRTFIRKKTRLVPLKIRKVYFYDPGKLVQSPLVAQSLTNMNLDPASMTASNLHMGANLNLGMDMKNDYKLNSLEASLSDRVQSSGHVPKVLLEAALNHQDNTVVTTHYNCVQNTVTNNHNTLYTDSHTLVVTQSPHSHSLSSAWDQSSQHSNYSHSVVTLSPLVSYSHSLLPTQFSTAPSTCGVGPSYILATTHSNLESPHTLNTTHIGSPHTFNTTNIESPHRVPPTTLTGFPNNFHSTNIGSPHSLITAHTQSPYSTHTTHIGSPHTRSSHTGSPVPRSDPTHSYILLSPMLGSKSVMLSPLHDPRTQSGQAQHQSRFVIVPLDTAEETGPDIHREHSRANMDTEPNNLVSMGRRGQGGNPRYNKVEMEPKYRDTAWVRPSPRENQEHWGQGKQEQWPPTQSDTDRGTGWAGQECAGNLYLPGKDYYDPPHYSNHGDHMGRGMADRDPYQANQRGAVSYLNNFRSQDEQERQLGNASHPRVATLKNTNIESEMLARRREYGANTGGRRVHYSDRDEDFGGSYNRRYQSPSPGPRQRPENTGGHHRSRRLQYSDERESLGYNHMDTSLLLEEEGQYNA